MADKTRCRKCKEWTNFNKWDLCRACRSFKCIDCGEPSTIRLHTTTRCGSCHHAFTLRDGRAKGLDRFPNQVRSIYKKIPADQSRPEETAPPQQ